MKPASALVLAFGLVQVLACVCQDIQETALSFPTCSLPSQYDFRKCLVVGLVLLASAEGKPSQVEMKTNPIKKEVCHLLDLALNGDLEVPMPVLGVGEKPANDLFNPFNPYIMVPRFRSH